jgi:hypothetical protein
LTSRQQAKPRVRLGNDDQLGGKIQEFCTSPADWSETAFQEQNIRRRNALSKILLRRRGKAYLSTMTKLLEHAVDSVRTLSPEVQDELARLLLQVAGEEQPVIQLTAEERADLADADAEIARGEFATDEQIRSMLAKRTV